MTPATCSTLQDGATAILSDVCATLSAQNFDYVIVGGWCPFLRGGNPSVQHPGTRDVDVLFSGDLQNVRRAVERLLSSGYLVSAKHEFQLLKTIPIAGRDFVFNVDLLHPLETNAKLDLYSDIMDLGIRESTLSERTLHVRSIVFPAARVIFSEVLWTKWPLDSSHEIPLLDEVGLVLSKGVSVSQVKRPRDAFDIYYVLSGPESAKIAARLKSLHLSNAPDQPLESLKKFVTDSGNVFDDNVSQYMPGGQRVRAAEYVRKLLFDD